ncbi:MAG: c-type cytochrome [Gammaproteobacteria bacterium]|nr:c-type cytochrome [Gammaproteobacteria bacterium]MDH3768400.1 c-type cytochrome [Gammaproteobacteria bacterium]
MNSIIRGLMAAAAIFSCAVASAQHSVSAPPLNEDERAALFPAATDIAKGKTLAESFCAGCHGLDGISADENLPHLAAQRTVYIYRVLQAYQKGDRADEAMARIVQFLSKDALLRVSQYYSNLAPPAIAVAPEKDESAAAATDQLTAGKKAAADRCAGCHGATGNSSIPGTPNLTAQHPDYFLAAIKNYQNGSWPAGIMKTLVSFLDEETIQNMGAYYAAQEPQPTATRGTGDSEAGEALAQSCAGCHGADGNADATDIPTLAGQDAQYAAKALREYRDEQRDHAVMVSAIESLNDEDIDDLASFYAEQKPRQARPLLSAEDWITRCDRCHGIGGNSTDPRFPLLAGQHEKYIVKTLETYVSGERSNVAMHAMSAPLRQADIERIAAHYASSTPKSVVYVELPCIAADEE